MRDLLVIRPHSLVDVITNSSSELFVCKTKKTVEQIKETLKAMVLVYTHAMKDSDDEWRDEEELLFEGMFGEIRVAEKDSGEEDEDDLSYYGGSYKKGDILIYSASDNSIPFSMFQQIEDFFNAERYHLG